MPWLERDWAQLNDTRRRLLATALARLGRSAESADLLQAVFEQTISVHDLTTWLGLIAQRCVSLGSTLEPLAAHANYVAEIRRKHTRMVSFWAYVNGMRQVESETDSDDDDGIPDAAVRRA